MYVYNLQIVPINARQRKNVCSRKELTIGSAGGEGLLFFSFSANFFSSLPAVNFFSVESKTSFFSFWQKNKPFFPVHTKFPPRSILCN